MTRWMIVACVLAVLAGGALPLAAGPTSAPDTTAAVGAPASQPDDNEMVKPAVTAAGPLAIPVVRPGEVSVAPTKPAPPAGQALALPSGADLVADLLRAAGDPATGTRGTVPSSQDIIKDLGVDKKIEGIEQSVPPDRPGKIVPLDQPTGPKKLLPEGTIIRDQVGHVRRDRGRFIFVFDTDRSGGQDPPLILLPNAQLQSLLSQSNAGEKAVKFRITGSVTQYQQTNYLLVQMVLVEQNLDRF